MDCAAETCVPCLPQELVTRVLQYVQSRQRLRSCALVSRSWHTAAVAATTTIDVTLGWTTSASSLEVWLQRSGSHVSALHVVMDGFSCGRLQLPFGQLQHLQQLGLKKVPLNFGPASDTSSSSSLNDPHTLGALTSLTSLQLEDVNLPSGDFLAPLSALTNLRRLQLVEIAHHNNLRSCGAHVGSALANLTHLTHLTLEKRWEPFVESAVTALSCLQQLQELNLASTAITAASCAQLPLSLTQLSLEELHKCQLSSSSTPRLAQLTGLKELTVWGKDDELEACIHPEVLSNLVQLQRLTITMCSLSPDDEAGTAALLGVLPHFTQLQHLGLVGTLQSHALRSSYAALVPPSLTSLDLRDCELPEGAAQAMFAAPGRQLPGLRMLRLGLDWFGHCICLGPGDVCSLVSCCSGLQELWLVGAVQPGVEMTALVQMTGLTALTAGGAAVNDAVAEQVLAQLTGLEELRVQEADSFTEAGLVVLTRLKQLQSLKFWHCGLELEYDYYEKLEFSSNTASPPDVWQQLQEHCMQDKRCLCAMLKQQEERLANTTSVLTAEVSHAKEEAACLKQAAKLQQQLTESQAQLAVVQEEAAARQRMLTRSQQQLAAAHQQSEEWRQLFGQSQQLVAAAQQQMTQLKLQLAAAQQQ